MNSIRSVVARDDPNHQHLLISMEGIEWAVRELLCVGPHRAVAVGVVRSAVAQGGTYVQPAIGTSLSTAYLDKCKELGQFGHLFGVRLST